MPKEDFQIKGSLGKGSFGCVVKCVRIEDSQQYAMKQIKLQKLKDKDKQNALNEIRILASIQHPYIVAYKQAFYDEPLQTLCVVMEYANQGDLDCKVKKMIKKGGRFHQKQIWKAAYQLLEGLNKLQQSNIIHRDIKSANVFFHNGTAKIGDLNVSKHLKDKFTITQTGTPYFASPQVWSQEPYDYKTDIWSLGCVLYQMAMLKPPFRAQNVEQLYKKVLSGVYDKLSSIYTKQLAEFIGQCLTVNQKNRPYAKQLLNNSVLKELKDNISTLEQCEVDQLMGTIVFPTNLKSLNSNLPKPKYQLSNKPKTAKIIQLQEPKSVKIMLPSLKNIKSQKKIQDSKDKTIVPKPKVLGKVASQKLIF